MLAMMFGQLSNRESLRDLIVAFEAHRAKQYHLGLGREPIAKTTLATANQNRDYRIFEEFAFYMMKEACEKRTTNILDISGKKYAFDSTTIPLCLATFPWAKFRSKITHYQAEWTEEKDLNVPIHYPGELIEEADFNQLSEAMQKLVTPYMGTYDKTTLESLVLKAEMKATSLGVQLYCGEFGCYKKTPAADRPQQRIPQQIPQRGPLPRR